MKASSGGGSDATFELLTPPGPGGVAVVALRGPGRRAAAAALLRRRSGSPAKFTPGEPPRLALLCIGGEVIDEVLVLERADTVELHLHASVAVLSALEARVGRFLVPAPGRGERLLREARSEAQLALALEQGALDFGAFLEDLARLDSGRRRAELDAALRRSRVSLALACPARLVLCGARNAGKSTLMNRLLFDERVLTGSTPGLTRDPVREVTTLCGYPYLLVDTAGEGPPSSSLEARAMARGRQERADALVLVVADGSRVPGACERALGRQADLLLRSKADLPPAAWPGDLLPGCVVSCLEPSRAPDVRRALGARLRGLRELPEAGPVGGLAALDAQELERLAELA